MIYFNQVFKTQTPLEYIFSILLKSPWIIHYSPKEKKKIQATSYPAKMSPSPITSVPSLPSSYHTSAKPMPSRARSRIYEHTQMKGPSVK